MQSLYKMDVVAYNKLILLVVLCSIYLEASILPRNKRQTIDPQLLLGDSNTTAIHDAINIQLDDAGNTKLLNLIRANNGSFLFTEETHKELLNIVSGSLKEKLESRYPGEDIKIIDVFFRKGTELQSSLIPSMKPTPMPTPSKTSVQDEPSGFMDTLNLPSSTCNPSITSSSARINFCSGDLIFKEEFNVHSLGDLKNWQKEIKIPKEPDYPFNVYMKNSLSVEDGTLSISPILTAKEFSEGYLFKEMDLSIYCTGISETEECYHISKSADIIPPVITGKVNTRNKFSFRYGRVEIRAKLPGGDWIIPEINLEPRDKIYGNSKYESGLIRIAFAKGNAIYSKDLYGGPILSDKDPFRTTLLKRKHGIESWNNDFHNYSMIWNTDGLEFYVDEEYYGAVNPGEGFRSTALKYSIEHADLWDTRSPAAPLDQMFYISLGLRVGGINDFLDSKQKPWRNTSFKAKLNFWEARDQWLPTWKDSEMQIDYVRVYAL